MKVMTETQKQKFIDLSCALSPENLYCDGEISHSQAQVKYNKIMKEWQKLEEQVGRKVDQYEPFNW